MPNLPAQMRELFGNPPLLHTESLEAYDNMLLELERMFGQLDIIEKILLKEWVDYTFDINRLQRLAVKKIDLHALAREDERVRDAYRNELEKVENANNCRQALKAANKNFEQVDSEKKTVNSNVKLGAQQVSNRSKNSAWIRAMKIVAESDIDADYIDGYSYAEQDCLEFLHASIVFAEDRREALWRQLERHRSGLGAELRKLADKVIEGKYTVVEEK